MIAVHTTKWLRFLDAGPSASGKTRLYTVAAVAGTLGEVRWFGSWRCYAFYPNQETVYEPTCLRDIADFCADQTTAKRMSSVSGVKP